MSGIFFSGPPSRILQGWRDGEIRVCISAEIFEEYQAVVERLESRLSSEDLGPILGLLAVGADLHVATPQPNQVCDDPDDDKFLACAIAAECTLIISGDNALLRVSGYRGVEVMRPRAFVERYLES